MIIEKIIINNFGKLKNLQLKFTEGINVIYGENEKGKSTIQAYIKAMLYGFSGKRTKDIKNNDRLKYTPWSGDKPSGELTLKVQENTFILHRSFGATKKEDSISAYEALTGNTIDYLNDYTPGNYLLDLTEEGFEKTLNIRQLNTSISKGKEDEIMQKISNLQETGEEDISFDKAYKTLMDSKKQITNARKTGELDLLKDHLSKLYEDYNNSLTLGEENIESQLKLNELYEKRGSLEKELKKLELYKKHIKKLKIHKEYKELIDYLSKSESLKAEKEQVEEGLNFTEGIIDDLYVTTLKEEYALYVQLNELLEEREEELKAIKELYEEKLKEINHRYNGFMDLSDDTENKVRNLQWENNKIDLEIKLLEASIEEVESLNREIAACRIEMGAFSKLDGKKQEWDRLLINYQEKLKELKAKVESSEKLNKPSESKAISKNFIVNNFVLALITLITVFVAIDVVNIPNKLIKYLVFGLGLLGTVFFIIRAKDINSRKKTIKILEDEERELKILETQIKELENKLEAIMNGLGVTNYQDFIKGIKKYEELSKSIEILNIKIEDRSKNINDYRYNELLVQRESNERILNTLYKVTNTDGVEDFLMKYNLFKNLNIQCTMLKNELLNHENSINSLREERDNKEKLLRKRLETINMQNISLDRFPIEIQNLSAKLQKLKDVENEFKAINNTYKALLKDRDIESLKNEIGELSLDNLNIEYESEEDIDEAIKKLNVEYIKVEKDIKDLENFLKNIFYNISPVWIIEENINTTKELIGELERKVKIIDIALDALMESFKEIQKSFGPLLNHQVSKVFRAITEDKYSEIKVSEDYTLTLRDKEENLLFQADYLSSGTFDQIYLSLRLGLIHLIFGEKLVPIILDDAFVQYDDLRLKKVLEFLVELSKHKQIILFTCQKREVEILKDISQVNVINL